MPPRLAPLLALGLAALTAPCRAAPITLSTWTPIYQGVDAATATFSGSTAYAVRVALDAPGVRLTSTPASGPLDTTAQTTSQFLRSSGAQVAINANFFDPCCTAAAEPKNLEGLAISGGRIVSAPDAAAGGLNATLAITGTGLASIGTLTGANGLAGIETAVSGSGEILTHGVVTVSGSSSGDPLGIDPRTDIGLSQDGRTLYLAVIDGRQPGYSLGVTDADAAALLAALGAYDGINLDGGGSSALVEAGPAGPVVVNRPSGGTERYDGNNLGVFAAPLPVAVPEPGSLALLATGTLLLAGLTLRRRA